MSNDESEPANQGYLRHPLQEIRGAICGSAWQSLPIHRASDHAQRHAVLCGRGSHPHEGYYYTFYSLGLLAAVEALLIIPHGLFDRLWFYALTLLIEAVALYFFTSSVWYWVSTHRN